MYYHMSGNLEITFARVYVNLESLREFAAYGTMVKISGNFDGFLCQGIQFDAKS